MIPKTFIDRRDGGRQLAKSLRDYTHQDDVLVLALPSGGVPVAYEVALALYAPLDVFVVRKLGVPNREEMAMGAIASGGVRVLNQNLIKSLRIDDASVQAVTEKEQRELERRDALYRSGYPAPKIEGKTVILVDDGLATGATMHAAVEAVNEHQPARVVVAVPTAAQATCDTFKHKADDVVCVITPKDFRAVGLWYQDFGQTTDDEVRLLLKQVREHADIPMPEPL